MHNDQKKARRRVNAAGPGFQFPWRENSYLRSYPTDFARIVYWTEVQVLSAGMRKERNSRLPGNIYDDISLSVLSCHMRYKTAIAMMVTGMMTYRPSA